MMLIILIAAAAATSICPSNYYYKYVSTDNWEHRRHVMSVTVNGQKPVDIFVTVGEFHLELKNSPVLRKSVRMIKQYHKPVSWFVIIIDTQNAPITNVTIPQLNFTISLTLATLYREDVAVVKDMIINRDAKTYTLYRNKPGVDKYYWFVNNEQHPEYWDGIFSYRDINGSLSIKIRYALNDICFTEWCPSAYNFISAATPNPVKLINQQECIAQIKWMLVGIIVPALAYTIQMIFNTSFLIKTKIRYDMLTGPPPAYTDGGLPTYEEATENILQE